MAGLAARTRLITGTAQGTMGKPALEKTAVGYCDGTTTLRGDQGAFTVGREERNCGVCGHTQYKGGMAMAGEETPPTVESSENQIGADMAAGGGLPAEGQDRGATAGVGGMSMDESAQSAGARAPSVIGPEGVNVQGGPSTDGGVSALAGTGDSAQMETAQGARGAPQQQKGAQRALLLEQAKKAAARLAELMGELAKTEASTTPEEAGLGEGLRAAAAALQKTGPECQVTESLSARGERSLVVGVLRADRSEAESGWQCKVPTCAEDYHPLIACLQFLSMTPEERMELVATASLCWGCLTPGHGAAVRTCPFREELRGCAPSAGANSRIISYCTWKGSRSSIRTATQGGAPVSQLNRPCTWWPQQRTCLTSRRLNW